jgi:hypothetical protein
VIKIEVNRAFKKVKMLTVALAIIAKAFLAAITPLSIDFINIAISPAGMLEV